jgi:hypothetical protein
MLLFGEPRRQRNKEHLKFIAAKACLVCGRQPSDPHHLRFTQPRALGRKVSDEFTVPLCRTHHREVHRYSDETKWWSTLGLDPITAASSLWAQSHARGPMKKGENATPVGHMEEGRTGLTRLSSPQKTRGNNKTKPISKGDCA